MLLAREYRIFLLGIISSFFISQNLHAQFYPNLVPNPGFEDLNQCPDNIYQFDRINYWLNLNTATPDLWAACCSPSIYCGNPANFAGGQYPYEGENYIGLLFGLPAFFSIPYREGAIVSLDTDLHNSKKYAVGFKISLADSAEFIIPDIRVYFTDFLDTSSGSWDSLLESKTKLVFDILTDVDTISWTSKCKVLLNNNSERYMSIGNNLPNSQLVFVPVKDHLAGVGGAYYYIDSFFVNEIRDVEINQNVVFICNNNFTVEANYAEEYRWYKYPDTTTVICSDSIFSTSTSLDATYLVKGRICDYFSWDTLRINACGENFIDVYPNPTSDYLYFNYYQTWFSGTDVYIFNHLGQVVYIKEDYYPNTALSLPVLANGIYYYHIIMDNNSKFKGKFIYKK